MTMTAEPVLPNAEWTWTRAIARLIQKGYSSPSPSRFQEGSEEQQEQCMWCCKIWNAEPALPFGLERGLIKKILDNWEVTAERHPDGALTVTCTGATYEVLKAGLLLRFQCVEHDDCLFNKELGLVCFSKALLEKQAEEHRRNLEAVDGL